MVYEMYEEQSSLITRAEYLEAKKMVEMHKALVRLRQNPDFSLLIEEGYLRDTPLSLVSQLGNTKEDSSERKELFDKLTAVSHFKKHLEYLESSIHNDTAVLEQYEMSAKTPSN